MNQFKLVILESPFAAPDDQTAQRHLHYAREAMRQCLILHEAPMASHLLYTQPGVLNDLEPQDRLMGIQAGLAWGVVADETAVYYDLGISTGMYQGILDAMQRRRPISFRNMLGWQTKHTLDLKFPNPRTDFKRVYNGTIRTYHPSYYHAMPDKVLDQLRRQCGGLLIKVLLES